MLDRRTGDDWILGRQTTTYVCHRSVILAILLTACLWFWAEALIWPGAGGLLRRAERLLRGDGNRKLAAARSICSIIDALIVIWMRRGFSRAVHIGAPTSDRKQGSDDGSATPEDSALETAIQSSNRLR